MRARVPLAAALASLCLVGATARAASLDNLEVAGAWGSPGATDGAAVWWNPAGLSAGQGTRILVEGAPTFAVVDVVRADPHGGADRLALQGVVPFAGLATDLGVPGLGLGLGVGAPYVRGGEQSPADGPVRYALRDGHVQVVSLLAGGGYTWKEKVGVGLGLQVYRSTFDARLDNELMPDLYEEITALGQDPGYTDADLEDPDYATTLDFQALSDWAVGGSAGIRVRPTEQVALSAAWVSGFHVDNRGDVALTFGCPPQEDTLGRFGAESRGLCDATMEGAATVSYDMPSRLHGSVQVWPVPALVLEAMGGAVLWSAHTDYDITIGEIGARNPELPEETVELVERQQLWARDNRDSYWVGLDAKGTIRERVILGGRLTWDRAAVPDAAVLANNYDANDLILGGLVAGRPLGALTVGLSWSHHFLQTRTVTDSAFRMNVLPEDRPEERYHYPHGNGSYAGRVDRIGLSARVEI